jgi:hypothetical protein
LSETGCYDLEKAVAFGVPTRILRDPATELYKTLKTPELSQNNRDEWDPYACNVRSLGITE